MRGLPSTYDASGTTQLSVPSSIVKWERNLDVIRHTIDGEFPFIRGPDVKTLARVLLEYIGLLMAAEDTEECVECSMDGCEISKMSLRDLAHPNLQCYW